MTDPEWRALTNKMLRHGLGVEDISITLKIPADRIRAHVRALRKSGRLTDVLWGRRYRGA